MSRELSTCEVEAEDVLVLAQAKVHSLNKLLNDNVKAIVDSIVDVQLPEILGILRGENGIIEVKPASWFRSKKVIYHGTVNDSFRHRATFTKIKHNADLRNETMNIEEFARILEKAIHNLDCALINKLQLKADINDFILSTSDCRKEDTLHFLSFIGGMFVMSAEMYDKKHGDLFNTRTFVQSLNYVALHGLDQDHKISFGLVTEDAPENIKSTGVIYDELYYIENNILNIAHTMCNKLSSCGGTINLTSRDFARII